MSHRSQPGCLLGEDMPVLSSFYPGGHGELEPESLFVWLLVFSGMTEM